jgi:NAD(P)-dependent dehydrogenase (short-subunit alcohol dehydrogenase family)
MTLVVVTGAAGGIGRATALRFAQGGARVAVCDVDQAGLDALGRELGDRLALAKRVDVSDRAQMKAFADAVHAIAPAADVVVNNAGVGLSGGILDTSLDDWDWVLRINLGGVIHGSHFFAPAMVAQRRGHIINVSSCLGYYPAPGVVGYVTSKFAVLGMSLSMRAELAPHKVHVTAICPGLIATGIVEKGRFAGDTGETRARAVKMFRERGRSPEQVADAIVRAAKRAPAVRPVAPEAWALWALSRLAPGAAGDLGRRVRDRFAI